MCPALSNMFYIFIVCVLLCAELSLERGARQWNERDNFHSKIFYDSDDKYEIYFWKLLLSLFSF